MAKLVDAPDSKSGVAHPTYRFESGLRQIPQKFFLSFWGVFKKEKYLYKDMENQFKYITPPSLSIILPCYNVDKYIEKALCSLINQTIKNIEIICINDGSSDKTLNIINEYALKDDRIKVYSQKNQGQGIARNKGICHATAPYIAFMDPDDWVEPDMYENLYKLASNNDVDFVECGFNKYYESTDELKPVLFSPSPAENKVFNYTNDKNYVFKQTAIPVWNKLFKKSFIIDNNIYFSEKKLYEDQIFTLKAKVLAKKIIYTPNRLYNYNIHPESALTIQKKENIHFDDIINEITDFFKSINLYNEFKEDINATIINIVREHYTLCPDTFKKEFLKHAKNVLSEDLYKVFKKNRKIENKNRLIENIFSLKNENKFGVKYKRITFLGLKIEFKIRR